jgi:hypothetical protein
MEQSEVPIEAIRAEIRESLGRARALVNQSERFARERATLPPKIDEAPDQTAA